MRTTQDTRANARATLCAQEPLHKPGTIQPYGALLVADASTEKIVQVSANIADFFATPPQRWLGVAVSDCLQELRADTQEAVALRAAVGRDFQPLTLQLTPAHQTDGCQQRFDGFFHHNATGKWLIEIEPYNASVERASAALHRCCSWMGRLQQNSRLLDILQLASDELRQVTGMDRVVAIQFDCNDDPVVVAESKVPGVTSVLHVHYPAFEIPAQARVLYLRQRLRHAPDTEQVPAALHPADMPGDVASLDMSLCQIRAIGPSHMTYMRNMGVRSTLSVSIVVDETLWGVLTCHHRTPLRIPYAIRYICNFLGHLVSRRVEVENAGQRANYLATSYAAQQETIADLTAASAPWRKNDRGYRPLLKIVEATGALVVQNETLQAAVGVTPPPLACEALLRWLYSLDVTDLYANHHLSGSFPDAMAYADCASGVLWLRLQTPGLPDIVWLRGETILRESWVGEPEDALRWLAEGKKPEPRANFKPHVREVRGHALAWKNFELVAARDFRHGLFEVMGPRVAQLEGVNMQLHEALRLRNEFISMASHELRTPVTALTLRLENMLRKSPRQDPMRPNLLRMWHQGNRLARLIERLLDASCIDAGQMLVRKQDHVDVSALVRSVAHHHTDHAIGVSQPLKVHVTPGMHAACDPVRIEQVVDNFLSNARKYGKNKPVTLVLRPHRGNVLLTVKDRGLGICAAQKEHLFRRYHRLVDEREYPGLGLGLWICKKIMQAHDGSVSVVSATGSGTTFLAQWPMQPRG